MKYFHSQMEYQKAYETIISPDMINLIRYAEGEAPDDSYERKTLLKIKGYNLEKILHDGYDVYLVPVDFAAGGKGDSHFLGRRPFTEADYVDTIVAGSKEQAVQRFLKKHKEYQPDKDNEGVLFRFEEIPGKDHMQYIRYYRIAAVRDQEEN